MRNAKLYNGSKGGAFSAPLTYYLLPITSYLLPLTSYLLPLTYYLLPKKKSVPKKNGTENNRGTTRIQKHFYFCTLVRFNAAVTFCLINAFAESSDAEIHTSLHRGHLQPMMTTLCRIKRTLLTRRQRIFTYRDYFSTAKNISQQ